MCPLGAFAFYMHFNHDVVNLTQLAEIDWALNSTWRQVSSYFSILNLPF